MHLVKQCIDLRAQIYLKYASAYIAIPRLNPGIIKIATSCSYQNTSNKTEYAQAGGSNNRNIYKVAPYAKCGK